MLCFAVNGRDDNHKWEGGGAIGAIGAIGSVPSGLGWDGLG